MRSISDSYYFNSLMATMLLISLFLSTLTVTLVSFAFNYNVYSLVGFNKLTF